MPTTRTAPDALGVVPGHGTPTGGVDPDTAFTGADAFHVVEALRDARVLAHLAAVTEVEQVVAWARLHPCPDAEATVDLDAWDSDSSDPGQSTLAGDSTLRLAGPGAPTVAEFALAELSAALDLGHQGVWRLVGECLELVHRLPRLWEHTRAGRVPVWRARAIAALTCDLDVDAVAHADRLLAATPSRITAIHAQRLVDEARLYADPDRAVEEENRHLDSRGAWLEPTRTPAVTGVRMLLDTRDAHVLDQTLGRLAHELRALGDIDPLQVRRATAVGVLADPQHALDLMTGRPVGVAEGQAGSPSAGPTRAPRPVHTHYVHVTPTELAAAAAGGTGVGTAERLDPATTELIRTWLTGASHARTGVETASPQQTDRTTWTGARRGVSIRVRPVLDLARDEAVDQHDPPPLMREQVQLRDAHCVFPGCRRDSRRCDLDHVDPYVPLDQGGPAGQTRPSNLAPLCRTHHRVKTHGDWTYRRDPGTGTCTWTSPTGHTYAVSPPGRRPLERPDGPVPPEPPRPSRETGSRVDPGRHLDPVLVPRQRQRT